MLNASDSETIASLNVLRHTVANTKRPIALWLGAGVSRWAGLPSWHELARQCIRVFSRQVSGFPTGDARAALSAGDYPEVFQICERSRSTLYHSALASRLSC